MWSPGGALAVTVLSLAVTVSVAQRRIMEGVEVSGAPNGTKPSYVVYLVEQRDNASAVMYSDGAWLCAGAVVHASYVLTSGACLSDINGNKKRSKSQSPIWVISGTRHYVYGAEKDAGAEKCASTYKRIINKTYIPYSSNFSYLPVEKWVSLDIGIAQVDPPYSFDGIIGFGCDYAVTKVEVNFDEAHQRDGMDALVFGWGHTESFRELGDRTNRNSPRLQYAPVMLMSKQRCSAEWLRDDVRALINKYMICTKDRGNLNDQGELIKRENETASDAASFIVIDGVSYMKECGMSSRRHEDGVERAKPCVSDGSCICPSFVVDRTRRRDDDDESPAKFVIRDGVVYWRHEQPAVTLADNSTRARALRLRYYGPNVGFCQNDHGAPLVAWAGPRLKLIGVASAFLVRPDQSLGCVGPYLYMSTHCNGAFIKCVITNRDCPEMAKNNLRIAVTTVFLRSSSQKK